MTNPLEQVLEALEGARQFIVNGVEFGYIRMPDADTPDRAHQTLPEIESAITTLRAHIEAEKGCGNSGAYLCIRPACGDRCHQCNHAISPKDTLKFATRYAWLREHACLPMAKITIGIWGANGNSHAGTDAKKPESIDAAIDAAIQAGASDG